MKHWGSNEETETHRRSSFICLTNIYWVPTIYQALCWKLGIDPWRWMSSPSLADILIVYLPVHLPNPHLPPENALKWVSLRCTTGSIKLPGTHVVQLGQIQAAQSRLFSLLGTREQVVLYNVSFLKSWTRFKIALSVYTAHYDPVIQWVYRNHFSIYFTWAHTNCMVMRLL